MSNIAGRKIDARPIVGAVVVFTIIGAIIFGVYFFFIQRPAAEELEQAKLSALNEINLSLAGVGTDQALEAASNYAIQVQDADSKGEVNAILVKVTSTAQVEQVRKKLQDRVEIAVSGTYFKTADDPKFVMLLQILKENINTMTTMTQLEAYEPQIDSLATLTWRAYLKESLGKMTENRIVMYLNSPVYGEYISKENAMAYVGGQTWETLHKLKFEDHSTIEVPVLDTFQRTPTIKINSVVKIYIYDRTTENMRPLWGNATVSNVIYSQSDIATIAWALTNGDTTQSYSINMWETIKAAAAGDPEAAAVAWQNYGVNIMDRARSANIGDYEMSVIYVVKVPDIIGEEILRAELHMTETEDVILVAVV